jgi:PAS domain S-box-containing protein
MKPQTAGSIFSADNLTVSYKSPDLITNVLTGISDAIILTDEKFNVTGWNPAAENLFGRNVDEAKGKLIFEIIDINFPGTSLNNMLAQLQDKGFWNGDIVYDRFDGQRFYLNTIATLIYKDINILSGCIFTAKNITDERVKDKKLIQAEAKYQTVIDTLVLAINVLLKYWGFRKKKCCV